MNANNMRQVDATGRQIREAQLERAAIPPARRLGDLLVLLQEHAQLSALALAGNPRSEARRAAVKADIERIQGRTRPPVYGWQLMAADWGFLARAVDLRAVPAAECDEWHASLIRQYKAFMHAMEQLDGRLSRRVEDLRAEQRRNLGAPSLDLLCG